MKNNKEFNIPENYFTNLDDKILKKVTKNSFREFTVPKNYFDVVESKIIVKTNKKRKIQVYFLRSISIAAALAILITVYRISYSNKTSYVALNQEEIIDYLSENMDSDTLDVEININEITNIPIPKEELINYLEEEENEIDEEIYNNL